MLKIFFAFLFILFTLMIYFVYVSGSKPSLAKNVVSHPKTLKQALALGKHYYDTPLGASNFSCESCHPGGRSAIIGGKPTKPVIGAAAHYPTYKKWGKIITMQDQFNHCIYVGEEGFKKKIGSKTWKYLDLYVYSLSKGYKINIGK